MNFGDRLDAAIRRRGNACLVGLDPHLELLPPEYAAAHDPAATRAERAEALRAFCCDAIDVVAGRVPAVKPQSAFFERLGADGARAWEAVVERARAAELLVIGDVKRGDIDSTARAYAQAFLDPAAAGRAVCDAITVSPYLGGDAVQPFLEACRTHDAGVFVLVRTSNKASGLCQTHGTPPLYVEVARAVDAWGRELTGASGLSSVGAVVGATHPRELAELRGILPRAPLLIPGYGAQGGGAADVAPGFLPGGRGALVNSSRGILFAYRSPRHAGRPWRDAARDALTEMIADLGAALRTS